MKTASKYGWSQRKEGVEGYLSSNKNLIVTLLSHSKN